MGGRFRLTSFILGLIGLSTSAVVAQTAAPSLNVSSSRTCGSPISVTATCQSGNTATFLATGGSASGNVYTYTAPGSYTLSATCTGSGGVSAPANPVSVAIFPPTSPPTLTPSSATVAQGGTPVTIVPSGCPGGYISYFGTMGVNRDGSITIPTGTPGVITVSAICTINDCQSLPAVANVTVTPSSTPVPQPTVANTIPSQTGTAGTTFTFLVPTNTFSDPNNDPLTLTVSGLPSALTFNGLFITGPLNVAGTFPITVTASNNRGGSVSTTFQLVVQPGSTAVAGPLQLLSPTYDPCSRAITFNTAGGDGTQITYTAVGVQRANAQSNTGFVEAAIVADGKTLIIQATQSGQTVSINFTPQPCSPTGGPLQLLTPTYDACSRAITFNTAGGNGTPISFTAIGVQRANAQSTTGTVEEPVVIDQKTLTIQASQAGSPTVSVNFTPPTCTTTPTGRPLQPLPPTYNACTRQITFNTTGGDGTPITYLAIGVQRSSPQSNTGVVEPGIVQDNKTLYINATQSGATVTISFAPPQCTTTTTPPTQGGPLQMLAPSYDPCSRVININTTGGDGTQITYMAIGVQRSSPQSSSGVVEIGIVLDNKTLNLVATQSGQSVSTTFAPPRCPSSAAFRNPDALSKDQGPQIVVLGNPANGNEITIEVAGAENQPLQVRMIDPQGQAVHDQKLQSAKAVERIVIPVRSSQKGIFLIQAISNGRATVTKVLHQ